MKKGARIFSGSFRPRPLSVVLSVVARSPDRASRRDRRSPGKVGRGDLRSATVARSGDRATTRVRRRGGKLMKSAARFLILIFKHLFDMIVSRVQEEG